jgi:hypothetical protein
LSIGGVKQALFWVPQNACRDSRTRYASLCLAHQKKPLRASLRAGLQRWATRVPRLDTLHSPALPAIRKRLPTSVAKNQHAKISRHPPKQPQKLTLPLKPSTPPPSTQPQFS